MFDFRSDKPLQDSCVTGPMGGWTWPPWPEVFGFDKVDSHSKVGLFYNSLNSITNGVYIYRWIDRSIDRDRDRDRGRGRGRGRDRYKHTYIYIFIYIFIYLYI